MGEVVGHGRLAIAAQGEGFELAAAGSAADAEIDAVGKHGVEGAKDFGDLERGVVREHDAAGADADACGLGGGAGDEDLGRGAGEQIHGVVLGVPEARVAEASTWRARSRELARACEGVEPAGTGDWSRTERRSGNWLAEVPMNLR